MANVGPIRIVVGIVVRDGGIELHPDPKPKPKPEPVPYCVGCGITKGYHKSFACPEPLTHGGTHVWSIIVDKGDG